VAFRQRISRAAFKAARATVDDLGTSALIRS
jgi:hypothetical protein